MDWTLTELSQVSLGESPAVKPTGRGSDLTPPTSHGFSVTCLSSPSLLGLVTPVTGDMKPKPGPRSYPAHLKFFLGLLAISTD